MLIILQILILNANGANEYMVFHFDEYDHAKEFAAYFCKTFRAINNEAAKIVEHTIRLADHNGRDFGKVEYAR